MKHPPFKIFILISL